MSKEYGRQPGNEPSHYSPEQYDSLLWEKAEELSQMRGPLNEYHIQLAEEISAMYDSQLNLHEKEVLRDKVAEYNRIATKLQDITVQEDRVTQALESIEAGEIDIVTLRDLLPPPIEQNAQMSKRRRRMIEERAALGVDPRELEWDLYLEFGSNATRLSTGRRKTKITGNYDSWIAEGEFYYQTADTHGGKVRRTGARNYYTNASGKRIRKR